MTQMNLAIPPFVNLNNAISWSYNPDLAQLFGRANEWKAQNGLKPAGSDRSKIHLLLIDVQKDFCFPEGTLYVGGRSGTGAIEDNKRIASFIYRNLGVLTEVTTTLDTHFAYQIFFPSFWQTKDGQQATPFATITTEAVRKGEMQPNPAVAAWLCNGNYGWLRKQVEFYCSELEKAGKYQLLLWPYHCILGSDGHALAGLIHEARMFHAFSRGSQSLCEVKGGNPLTENYSVLRPEVLMRHDGKALTTKNVQFIETLLKADAVIIAGQAASHCVKSSIDDLLDEIKSQDPDLAQKVYIMTDCMSAVTVPDGKGGFFADYTEEAEKAFQRFKDAGMNLVKSVDALDKWPGLNI